MTKTECVVMKKRKKNREIIDPYQTCDFRNNLNQHVISKWGKYTPVKEMKVHET